MRAGRSLADSYQQLRKRIIRETELAMLAGLEAGVGRFDPGFASRFWDAVFDMEPTRVGASQESVVDPDGRRLVR